MPHGYSKRITECVCSHWLLKVVAFWLVLVAKPHELEKRFFWTHKARHSLYPGCRKKCGLGPRNNPLATWKVVHLHVGQWCFHSKNICEWETNQMMCSVNSFLYMTCIQGNIWWASNICDGKLSFHILYALNWIGISGQQATAQVVQWCLDDCQNLSGSN